MSRSNSAASKAKDLSVKQRTSHMVITPDAIEAMLERYRRAFGEPPAE